MAKGLPLSTCALVVALLAAGCSSSSSNKPAVCSSIDQLKTSVKSLQDVQPSVNGLGTLKSSLTAVGDDLQQVGADAKSSFAPQATQIRGDVTALQSAIDKATGSRSLTDISAAATAAKTLGSSVQKLLDDAKSTC